MFVALVERVEGGQRWQGGGKREENPSGGKPYGGLESKGAGEREGIVAIRGGKVEMGLQSSRRWRKLE